MKDFSKKFFLRIAGFSACVTFFFAGCEGPLRPAGEPDMGSVAGSQNAKSAFWAPVNLNSQAMRIIREGLRDSDVQLRVNSVEVVGATKRIELMDEVAALLKDDFVPVRFAAALAVGDCEYHPAKNAVKQLLEKAPDEDSKIAAAYAMGKLGSAEGFRVVREAIGSRNQKLRAGAAFLLGKSGDKRALTVLYRALEDKNSDDKVRFQAVGAIARLGDERIYSKIWAMLISAYNDDRILGVEAMGLLGTESAKNALITMLDDKVFEVRLAAAEQLGMLGFTTGEPEVMDVFTKKLTHGLNKKDKERIYIRTALAIGQIGTPALVRFLPQLLKNESKLVRIAAAKAVFQHDMTKKQDGKRFP